MKKVNIKTIIITLCIIIALFLIYKFIMLQVNKSEYYKIDNSLIFNNTLNINEYVDSSNKITYSNISFNNYFEDYVENENNDLKVKYDQNNKVVSFYSINAMPQYINMLNINSFSLDTDNTNYSTDKNMKKYLEKNNIKNDIDLLKYIKENHYIKNNILTSVSNMKNNHLINEFVQVALPEFTGITKIEGKINGYIINIKSTISVREIHLLYNDIQYIITLSGNDITSNEFITNFLKSISFK